VPEGGVDGGKLSWVTSATFTGEKGFEATDKRYRGQVVRECLSSGNKKGSISIKGWTLFGMARSNDERIKRERKKRTGETPGFRRLLPDGECNLQLIHPGKESSGRICERGATSLLWGWGNEAG